MKIALSLIVIFLFIVTSSAQSRTIDKDEYEKVFERRDPTSAESFVAYYLKVIIYGPTIGNL